MQDASKRDKKNISRKWVKRVIYILIMVTLVAWSYSPIKTRIVQRRQIERLNDQLALEQRENNKLKIELKRLRSDKEFIETMAREKLGMIKADEEGYVVIDEEGSTDRDEQKDKSEDDLLKQTWWQRIMSIFDGE